MSCNALQCFATAKAYNRKREGAANAAWHRAKAKRQRARLVAKISVWNDESKAEIEALRKAQKAAFNANNTGNICKHKTANCEEGPPI